MEGQKQTEKGKKGHREAKGEEIREADQALDLIYMKKGWYDAKGW